MDLIVRCSALGALMSEPVRPDPDLITPEIEEIMGLKKRNDAQKAALADAKARSLSDGARTAVRKLLREEIFGVELRVDSKEMEKGRRLEPDAIALVNRVRGLALAKNTERRTDGLITGECDLFDPAGPRTIPYIQGEASPTIRRGHDTKVPWSIASMPISLEDCEDNDYYWQCQGYMRLWNAVEWDVDWCLLSTPSDLIRYEPIDLHSVDHIPAHLRLMTWTIPLDAEAQRLIPIKVLAARRYARKALAAWDASHRPVLEKVEETAA